MDARGCKSTYLSALCSLLRPQGKSLTYNSWAVCCDCWHGEDVIVNDGVDTTFTYDDG
jgi:hypothetical protein